jgi:hypothetical protein
MFLNKLFVFAIILRNESLVLKNEKDSCRGEDDLISKKCMQFLIDVRS